MIHIKRPKISICYFYYLIFFFNFFPSCVVMTALSDARRSVFVAEKSKIIFISWQFCWQISNAFSWHTYIVNCITRHDNDLIAGDDDVFARFSLWLNIGNNHNAHVIHEKCMVYIIMPVFCICVTGYGLLGYYNKFWHEYRIAALRQRSA